MTEKLFRLKRTDMCGNIKESQVGETLVVNGWVQDSRNLGGLIFINLRDISGIIQLVFDIDNKELCEKAAKMLGCKFELSINGTVLNRQTEA